MPAWGWVVASLVVIGVIGAIVDSSSKTNKKSAGNESDAYLMARAFVRERLKAPSTAEFPPLSEARVWQTPDKKWHAVAYVDSQNSFGAMIRTPWSCTVWPIGNDKWEVANIVLYE